MLQRDIWRIDREYGGYVGDILGLNWYNGNKNANY